MQSCDRRAVLPVFLAIVAGAFVLRALMSWAEPALTNWAATAVDGGLRSLIPAYDAWETANAQGDLAARVLWFVGDLTEGSFLKSVPSSIAMVVCTVVSAVLELRRSPHAGTGVAGNGRIFAAMFTAGLASLLVTTLVYGWTFAQGWVPSFVAFLSAQMLVTFYGASLPKVATISLLAGLLTYPVALLVMNLVTVPAGLPAYVAVGCGLAVSLVGIAELCRHLPWMSLREPAAPVPAAVSARTTDPRAARKFFAHRVLADASELMVEGSSVGAAGMYAGLVVGWLLNPAHAQYGSGHTADMVFALVACAAVAVFAHYGVYVRDGFAFTFASLLCACSVVNTYAPSLPVMLLVIIAAGLAVPALVHAMLRHTPVPGRWPAAVYVQVAAVSCTVALSLVVQAL